MHPERLLHDLNDQQREAVTAVAGPVCILAGAGTGKTRVVTRRVAYAAAIGAAAPRSILVVTFTKKAADEMAERLAHLGIPGVQARTFHAAALRQLRYFWGRVHDTRMPDVIESKVHLLQPIAKSLPGGYKYTPLKDLLDEIEWAKVQRVAPERYERAVTAAGRKPPLRPDLFAGVFHRYERAKERAGQIDFEDLLVLLLDAMEAGKGVAEEIREQYRWFSVDEYQDTNPLQQALLEAWLGGRDDLAVVGDADQTIYTFNGATSEYLTGFSRRHPDARVVRLERNYRSSPQVLALANRLLAAAATGGHVKRLEATRPDGPEPEFAVYETAEEEAAAVASAARKLADGDPPVSRDEIAVLVRTNALIPLLEEAFRAEGMTYQVRDRFYRSGVVRRALSVLRSRADRASGGGLVDAVEGVWYERFGFRRDAEPDGGAEARDRHAALVTLLGIAAQVQTDDERSGVPEFLAEMDRRVRDEDEGVGGGVNLLTLHRAKGLEFDAVFLPALEEGLVPVRQAVTPAELAEERRLLYVGLTRARVHLRLSYALRRAGPTGREGNRKGSRFLDDVAPADRRRPGSGRTSARPRGQTTAPAGSHSPRTRHEAPSSPLANKLRAWRWERAQADGVPPYVVFNDRTLAALAERRPGSRAELLTVDGIGPAKLDRYGADILALLSEDQD